ncbi:glutathione S-transferase [Rhodoligotrophos appendicifer]|uniref:glutathione S-transferase family protein n=1 Tax=Rhodoligotrophos appendicifer TaxID=987056 RepID=UPI00118553EE|nr:glutathione S-transferase family protein [Rhodoligotrophos appendicifer]
MDRMHIYLGNKNYSSWSLRPWLLMRHGGLDFGETVLPLDLDTPEETRDPRISEISPSHRVPVLRHGGITIWESLAIMEYLAETFAEKQFWPHDRERRAHARAISNEMHAGFGALRHECPCNLRRPVSRLEVSPACRRDVARIASIWKECRETYGSDGPFLFGAFSIADAMYAPVVNRFHIYELSSDPAVQAYMETILSLPAYGEWKSAAEQEPWVIRAEEV